MEDVLTKAIEYRKLFSLLKIAHELSAEWHRSLGEKLGGAEKGIASIVGTGIFVGVVSQFGLDGSETLNIPVSATARFLYFLLLLILLTAPLLTALQMFRKDAEQANSHRDSYSTYGRLEQRIDIFLLKYSTEADRIEALKELDEISKELQIIRSKSITLTKKAYKDAEEELIRREMACTGLSQSEEGATDKSRSYLDGA